MNKIIIGAVCGALLTIAPFVYAQETSATPTPFQIRQGIKMRRASTTQEINTLRTQNRASSTQSLDQFKAERQAQLNSATSSEARSALRLEIQQERQNTMAAIRTQREALQTQIGKIKDQQKQDLVLNINDLLTAVNTRVGDQLVQVTDRMNTILQNAQSRITKLQASGTDTSSINAVMQTATTALEAAQNAIKTQANKTYPITISGTGTAVQQDIVKVRQALMNDLTTVRNVVQQARTAIQQVATDLANLAGISPVASSTARSTQ